MNITYVHYEKNVEKTKIELTHYPTKKMKQNNQMRVFC